jgi:hypothetical protein
MILFDGLVRRPVLVRLEIYHFCLYPHQTYVPGKQSDAAGFFKLHAYISDNTLLV